MNVLFVCNCNLNRSPTAEKLFKAVFKEMKLDIEVRSAGIHYGYPYQVDSKLLEWADEIFLMTMEQYRHIKRHHKTPSKKMHVIGIDDKYDPDQDELIELLMCWWNHIGIEVIENG